MLAVVSDSQRPMLITFLIGAAGFVLLPLVQELDPRQPQWNYPAVFRAAWRNTVHLALAVCLSISVFVLLWIAGMMFRMIGINTVLDVLGHARFHIAAWPIVLAVSLVGVRRRPQIADTLRRSWLTLNAWLLPLVALVGLAFTIALAARMALGFEAVKLSAGALIAFCALWIKLINAAWQDSPGPRRSARACPERCAWPCSACCRWRPWRCTAWACGSGSTAGPFPRLGALLRRPAGAVRAGLRLPRWPAGFTARWRRPTSWPPSPRWSCWRWCRRPWPTRAASPRKASCRACWTAAWNRANTATAACATTTAAGARCPAPAGRRRRQQRDPRIAQAAASALTGKYYSWDEPKTDLIAASPTFDTVPAGRQAPDGWWKFLVQQNPYVAQTCATASTTPPATVKQYERDAPCLLLFVDLSGSGQEDLVLFTRVYGRQQVRHPRFAASVPPQDGRWLAASGQAGNATGRKAGQRHRNAMGAGRRPDPHRGPKERDLIIGDFRLQLR